MASPRSREVLGIKRQTDIKVALGSEREGNGETENGLTAESKVREEAFPEKKKRRSIINVVTASSDSTKSTGKKLYLSFSC